MPSVDLRVSAFTFRRMLAMDFSDAKVYTKRLSLPRFRFRQAQADRGQHPCHHLPQRLSVGAGTRDQDHEVVGVPTDPPDPKPLPSAPFTLIGCGHLLLVLPGEMLVEGRQGDISQKR